MSDAPAFDPRDFTRTGRTAAARDAVERILAEVRPPDHFDGAEYTRTGRAKVDRDAVARILAEVRDDPGPDDTAREQPSGPPRELVPGTGPAPDSVQLAERTNQSAYFR